MPIPAFISINAGTTMNRDESSVTRERIKSPTADEANPPTVKGRRPNRSESTPLIVPKTAMQSAPGTTTNPAVLAL